mmetsp:Transcript_38822/g.103054  ORF Transcript_38822/g.103054 Transcript_38822/m.103054 type:complete len:201 (-) Transcript_38822:256-858(-)
MPALAVDTGTDLMAFDLARGILGAPAFEGRLAMGARVGTNFSLHGFDMTAFVPGLESALPSTWSSSSSSSTKTTTSISAWAAGASLVSTTSSSSASSSASTSSSTTPSSSSTPSPSTSTSSCTASSPVPSAVPSATSSETAANQSKSSISSSSSSGSISIIPEVSAVTVSGDAWVAVTVETSPTEVLRSMSLSMACPDAS